jgi:hypothetical protein
MAGITPNPFSPSRGKQNEGEEIKKLRRKEK